jgi:hypothetical protein
MPPPCPAASPLRGCSIHADRRTSCSPTDTAFLGCLTFELSGRRRQDARARQQKMYTVPAGGPWWPAVGAPLERGVRPQRERWRIAHALQAKLNARPGAESFAGVCQGACIGTIAPFGFHGGSSNCADRYLIAPLAQSTSKLTIE